MNDDNPNEIWHTAGGWPTGPVFAKGTAFLFVDGYVLPAGILVMLT